MIGRPPAAPARAHPVRGLGRSVAGFSLAEMIVATTIASFMLSVAWPWCWDVAQHWSRCAAQADDQSTLAAVRRVTLTEVRQAVCLLRTPATTCSARSLAFAMRQGDAMTIVTYVWDQRRQVLWRKASGSHLAERVGAFAITYFDGDGRPLALEQDGTLPDDSLARVRRLRFSVTVGASEGETWDICPRRLP